MSGTIKNLQTLRFFAAFGVVFAHIALPRYAKDGISPTLFSAGAFGVDLFFVLSGFIMPYVAQNMKGSPIRIASEFFARRVFRVVPLYWAFTLVAFVLALMSVACPAGLSSCPFWLSEHYPLAKTSFKWVFQSLTFTHWDRNPIYDVGWTLIYEFWFYALFSLSLLLNIRATRFFALLFAVIVVVRLPALSTIFQSGIFRVLLHPMMIEFIFGVFLFAIFKQQQFGMKWIVPAMIAGAFFASLYQADFVVQHLLSFSRPLLLGSTAFCIIASALILENTGVTARKTLVTLGDASYSIYLSHWLVVTTLPSLLDVYKVEGINFATYIVIHVLVAMAFSGIVFYTLERPIREASKGKLKRLFPNHSSEVVNSTPATTYAAQQYDRAEIHASTIR